MLKLQKNSALPLLAPSLQGQRICFENFFSLPLFALPSLRSDALVGNRSYSSLSVATSKHKIRIQDQNAARNFQNQTCVLLAQ